MNTESMVASIFKWGYYLSSLGNQMSSKDTGCDSFWERKCRDVLDYFQGTPEIDTNVKKKMNSFTQL